MPQDANPISKDGNNIKDQCIAKHGQGRTNKKQLACIKSLQDKKSQSGQRVYVDYMIEFWHPFQQQHFP